MTTKLVDDSLCNCYKCSQKREIGTFKVYIDNFEKEVGFLPRNFNPFYLYNGKFSRYAGEKLEQVIAIKEAIEEIRKNNVTSLLSAKQTNRKMVYCFDCGRLETRSKTRLVKLNGKEYPICSVCKSNRYRRCNCCGYLHPKTETRRDTEGKTICTTCFDTYYFKCQRCNNVFKKEFSTRLTGRDNSGLARTYFVCSNCAPYAHNCNSCGTLSFATNEAWSRQRSLCQSCFSDNFSVKSYSHKPTPILKTGDSEKKIDKYSLFIGIEWELENNSDNSNTTQVAKFSEVFKPGFAYYKQDGSLSRGFEIVTHPFSWQHWKQNQEMWKSVIKKATEIIMEAQSNCGIHIHMTKSAFTPAHLYKFTKFIYDKNNRKFVVSISQRGGVCSYANFSETDASKKGMIHFGTRKKNDSGARHSAVNANGATTVEVRLFRSTTHQPHFFKNVEFVFSLFEFSNEFGFKDMTHKKYVEWLKKYSNKYPNLIAFLKEVK